MATITVNKDTIYFPATAYSETVTVTCSDSNWSVSTGSAWCSASKINNQTLRISIPNNSGDRRSTTISCIILIILVFLCVSSCSLESSNELYSIIDADTIADNHNTNVTVVGTPLERDLLVEFDYTKTISTKDEWSNIIIDYFNSINKPELSDLYFNASALNRTFSTDNLIIDDNLSANSLSKIGIQLNPENELSTNWYYETGYESNSFISCFEKVFTNEIVTQLFEKRNVFCTYNNELWAIGCSGAYDKCITKKEINTVENSSDEIVFDIINYFDESNIDDDESYEILRFKFSKNDDVWKISECPTDILW